MYVAAVVLFVVAMESYHWYTFCRIQHLVYAHRAYHPAVFLVAGRASVILNRLGMRCLGFHALGGGLYSSTVSHTEQTTLIIGGLLSPNLSTLYIAALRRVVGQEGTILVYNPPEATYGRGYEETFLRRTRLGTHCEQLIQQLLDTQCITHRSELGCLHILGHSYGTVLAGELRQRYPCVSPTRTWMLDPTPLVYDADVVFRFCAGQMPCNSSVPARRCWWWRQVVLSYFVRYPHFMQLCLQLRPGQAIDQYADRCGDLSVLVGSDDDMVLYPVPSLPYIRSYPGLHGCAIVQ